MSSRIKRRGREAEARTLPEELFGLAWARRLRVGIPVISLVLLVGGCFVFVVWSQVMGRLLLAGGLGLGLMWFVLRRGDPKGALAALRRRRRPLIAIGFGLIAAGAALFALVDQDLGLLLVVVGAAALTVNLIGVQQEPMASPMDGPMFGDTPPYGD